MHRSALLKGLICALALCAFASRIFAGDPPKMPDMAEMMKKWQAAMTPGEGHKALNQFVGDWDVTMKMYMDPSAPAVTTKLTSSVKWVLGGRFVEENIKGTMQMPDATGKMSEIPYEGRGVTGYDNFKHLYVSSWCDNINTQLLNMSGTASPDGKTIIAYGTMDEPMLDMVGRMVKYVTKVKDESTHTFEVYDLAAGDNYKVFEMEYKRK